MDRYLRRYAKCYNGFELAIVRFCSHFAREILKTVSNSCRNWDSHRVQTALQCRIHRLENMLCYITRVCSLERWYPAIETD